MSDFFEDDEPQAEVEAAFAAGTKGLTVNAHGTYGGYQKHKRTGTVTCEACRAAYLAYMREWRARTGRTKAHLVPHDLPVKPEPTLKEVDGE
jgi:hypothetical protein